MLFELPAPGVSKGVLYPEATALTSAANSADCSLGMFKHIGGQTSLLMPDHDRPMSLHAVRIVKCRAAVCTAFSTCERLARISHGAKRICPVVLVVVCGSCSILHSTAD